MQTQVNPFIFGDAVKGDRFLDRKRCLRRLATRIQHGASAIVTGEPRMGKTSLLLYLEENASTFIDAETAQNLIFRYLDAHLMAGWDSERFWREALRPLGEIPQTPEAYQQSVFDFNAWEAAFAALEKANYRFVLLIDEFGALQDERGLHQRAVYGPLRSLSTRSTSFSVIVASRYSLTELESKTKDFTAGSPYFNFMVEIPMQPFPESYVAQLLKWGDGRFTQQDHSFLKRLAGRHPYFLQSAAYHLWEAYEDEVDPASRYLLAATEFYQTVGEAVLDDIWRTWTPYVQMAFTLAALETMPTLLDGNDFDIRGLLQELPNLSYELGKLKQRGFLLQDDTKECGYAPAAEVLLWYLADELQRVLRPEPHLDEWLRNQRWEGMLKHSEKEALKNAVTQIGGLLKGGAETFIEAMAKGLGASMLH